MALFIKRGVRRGLLRRQAVEQGRAYLAAERSRQPDLHALDAAALAAIAGQIAQADGAVRQVLEVVVPLTPATEAAD